ncbi:hypothetical protein MY10362_004315 [Beauveria mimosiformis]
MLAVSRQFSTADGHNPEIIYHILENRKEFGPKPSYQALDNYLRFRGTSNRQARIMMEALRSEEDAAASRAHSWPWEGPVDVPQSPLSDEYLEALGNENMSDEDAAILVSSWPWEGPVDVPQSPMIGEMPNMSDEDAAILASSYPWEGPVDFPPSPMIGEIPEASGSLSMSEDEPGIYRALMERLDARKSVDLEKDTDDILDRDYFNGVHQIYEAQEVVRHMTTVKYGELQHFSPQSDWIRHQLEAEGKPMRDGPFDILLPDPVTPGKVSRQRVPLPHVYLPGWPDRPDDSLRSVEEWKDAMKLAEGRYHKFRVFYERLDIGPGETAILGFPNLDTFAHFIHRPEIKEAFRELWDASLKSLPGEMQLAVNKSERRPVGLRILYSRGLKGRSEFDAENPNKRDWPLDSHLARFCLKVETVCNRWKLPPMRGQIPMLAGKAPSSVVAWGGVELARMLRLRQKGYGSRTRYLDQASHVSA